ncbi:MAG TPA: ATP-binding protein [Aestuariivirgaceae bacterium]|nr:ATP-binding protein [Aestuariivirgaceae bacterium]
MTALAERRFPLPIDPASLLDSLPSPVLAIENAGTIAYANAAAEEFFKASSASLMRLELEDIIPATSPLFDLIALTRSRQQSFNEYGIHVGTPRTGGERVVDVQAVPVLDGEGLVLLSIQMRSVAQKLDQQLTQRNGVRTVTTLASMLAHEIKNPLFGIRGAAQLLESTSSSDDRALARLIQNEADRIRDLVDRMEVFSDDRPLRRQPVNIHEVLDHVKRVAQLGFAKNVVIAESYDPSLPPVPGDRNQLIQLFLNLLKNAAEAIREGRGGGTVTLATAFRPGVRLALSGGGERVALPLEVSVGDTGPGIPESLLPNLFDPFVTTKPNGKGLGLALAAKIVRDHGGIIECTSKHRHTVFRILLPMASTVPQDEEAAS